MPDSNAEDDLVTFETRITDRERDSSQSKGRKLVQATEFLPRNLKVDHVLGQKCSTSPFFHFFVLTRFLQADWPSGRAMLGLCEKAIILFLDDDITRWLGASED